MELEAVVDDWVVPVDEGVGSRAFRLGAMIESDCDLVVLCCAIWLYETRL